MTQNTQYKDELTKSMTFLGEQENTVFMGQSVLFPGTSLYGTLTEVPKEKLIEVPVFEETQTGMALGISLTNKCVVSIYPRWDFLILATNQIVNHIDKFELMTGYAPHVIIRVGKGSTNPLDPGHQHKADYSDAFKLLLTKMKVVQLTNPNDIFDIYKRAYENKKPIIIAEYPDLYYA
jgi:pyruvate/2-oxoglutarate/acetoin dehydrogenase E1 component